MDYRSCMKIIGTKKNAKSVFLGQNFEAVPVPPNRSQSVPVPIQAVLVPPYRMHSVPIPVRAVPVPQCPKCPDCVILRI